MSKWKQIDVSGFNISRGRCLNVLLFFTDDLLILRPSKHALLNSVFQVQQLCGEYSIRISITKTKVTAFRQPKPVRAQIVVNGKSLRKSGIFVILEVISAMVNTMISITSCIKTGWSVKPSEPFEIRYEQIRYKGETNTKFYKLMVAHLLLYETRRQESRIQKSEVSKM